MRYAAIAVLLLAYLAVVTSIAAVLWTKGHPAWACIVSLILVTGLKIHVTDT